MTATPIHNTQQKRYKGSLTGTLVRTLLIFTFIPLALMAGAAYFRARALLREQVVVQSQNLLTNQLKIIEREIKQKENLLGNQIENKDFRTVIELGLHANPISDQFRDIQNNFIKEFQKMNTREDTPVFDQFLLVDTKGNIKLASNPDWRGKSLSADILTPSKKEFHSTALYGLAPIYKDEFILVTALNYQTVNGDSILGSLVGITEKNNLLELIQPLNGISPLASTYFLLSTDQFIFSNPDTLEFALVPPVSANSDLKSKVAELMNSQAAKPESLDTTAPSGEAVLAQLQWFPAMQAGVILEVDATDIYGQIASLAPFTIVLVLGTLAATGIVLSLGINRIIKPIRSLSEITREFADGNWDQRAEVLSDDEVGLLANSFNNMANELSGTYRSLEQKVDERTRQIRTAAEVAQNITTISNLDEMLDKTTELLVQQFEFYQASIFLMDRGGTRIDFKAGFGAATKGLIDKKYGLEVGSPSIIGWVSANNQLRVASDILTDPLHLKNELLPETRSEVCVPISIGSLVLGVLDVQSIKEGAFTGPETLVMLRTLASQIAASIQTIGLV